MSERPIIFSVTTGQPSKKGQRLRSVDGLSWAQRNRAAVNARRRALYAADLLGIISVVLVAPHLPKH